MPVKIIWTKEEDLTILRMRDSDATWDDIAAVLKHSRYSCIIRGRELGCGEPISTYQGGPQKSLPTEEEEREQHEHQMRGLRDALKPGHPTTWDLITRGTVLQGSRYQ